MTGIITHRNFNYQSKSKLSHLVDRVRQQLFKQIDHGSPIHFYLLYNGGYRASSFANEPSHIFEPDQTELLLLYQIALLHSKVSSLYEPGIKFSIVVNNGVAHWVNNIPLLETEHYAKQFRAMIHFLGAESRVQLLVQSELLGFDPFFTFLPADQKLHVSEEEHFIVERFLGHRCTEDEAKHRLALYLLAESKWEKDLLPYVLENDAIVMRQVAHPKVLSFRPFPGGAIRSQNGSLGFDCNGNTLKAKLITSKTVHEYGIAWIPYQFPWITN